MIALLPRKEAFAAASGQKRAAGAVFKFLRSGHLIGFRVTAHHTGGSALLIPSSMERLDTAIDLGAPAVRSIYRMIESRSPGSKSELISFMPAPAV